MKRGTISYIDFTKEFGYISRLEGGEKLYFSMEGLPKEIKEKDKVTFYLCHGKHGYKAINVKIQKA